MGLSTNKLPLTILLKAIVIFILGFILLVTLYFFNILTLSISLGWLLGALISSLNYGSIIFQSRRLQQRIEAQIKTPYVSQGYAMARLIFSGLGMIICVLYKPNDVEVFNLFSLFAAYLVHSVMIYLTGAQYKVTKSI